MKNNNDEGVGLTWALLQIRKNLGSVLRTGDTQAQDEQSVQATLKEKFMRPGSFEIGETLDRNEKMEQFEQ